MAEFKLGRIRFVWKNQWTAGTTYYQDDVVAFGGKMYICVLGHNSADDFFSDLDIVPPKWNLVSDGQTWKGEWQVGTEYVYDDIVSYGARLYICNTIHTSASDSSDGLELDITKWDIFAEGLDWRGDWTATTRYIVNDIVKYGGTTYVCNTAHTSQTYLEDDLVLDANNNLLTGSKWDYFNRGIEYKNDWVAATRYRTNDVVRYGATLYISTVGHTAAADFATDIAKWDEFVSGVQYEDFWSPFKGYQKGDIVRHGGNQYIAKTPNSASEPTQNPTDWDLFSEGIRFLGEWNEDSANQDYKVGELVSHGGYTYICTADHSAQQPPNTDYWQRLNTGLRWRGTWLDDQEYILGDVVRYDSNTFVCVQGHISEGDDFSTETPTDPGGGAQNSRPDQDVTGTYWNTLAIGSEESVLTTKGDLVYYSGAGATRLPIGEDGQILQVSQSGVPEWAYLGNVEDVYYVAEFGLDRPAPIYGKTIDRPFKTIRYACEQVEQGARNPAAKYLLTLNRQFVQREILEYIEWQVANADPGSIWENFTFDTNKCYRDMGLIVDAVINDISKGGNVKSREAALSYVNETAGSPYLTQKTQTVDAINYGLTVIEDVLNQDDPAVNYQVLNGDNSTAIIAQYKDATKVAEDVLTDITGLVGIITDAITAGNDTNIPARLIRNTLIKVSTGKHYETLPIMVPAECCVIGDELRSTNVQPRTATNSTLTPKGDVKFSYKALERLEDVIDDIVLGQTVTPTTGNNETQSQDYPFGEQLEADASQQLVRVMRQRIDHKLGDKNEVDFPRPYEMSNTNLGLARDLIIDNKDFAKAELIAYIADQFPNIKYSKTKCKQDVGFILDAIAYDLTYGGNWQSSLAGQAYFTGAGGSLQIDSSESTATLGAYNYLKSILPLLGRGVTVTPTYQTAVEQVLGVGSAVAISTETDALIDQITSIINAGTGELTGVEYPDISGVSQTLQDAASKLVENGKQIGVDTIDFISKNFGSFRYNSAKCRRDLNLILGDLAYDAVLGTNYNGVFTGLAYQRGNNAYNLAEQRIETTGAIQFARDQAKISVTTDGSSAVGSTTASARLNTSFTEIVDIINNGADSADTVTYPVPAGAATTRQDAENQLEINKEFIVAEVIAWINNEINDGLGSSGDAIWDDFVYNETKCARDVRYIIDGMRYDILYQGTMATTRIAQSYFSDDGAIQVYGQEAQTTAAYDHLSTVIQDVVRGVLVSASPGNTESQDNGTYGDAGASIATELDGKIQIIEDVITAGNLDSLPTIVYPDITFASAELQAAKSNLDSDRNDIIADTIQFINTTYNDFNYDQAKCQRDIQIIIEAANYDYMLGTTFASYVAGYSYLREPSAKVVGDQKAATIAANEFARTLAVQYVNNNATAITGINTTWEIIEDIILGGSAEAGLLTVDNDNSLSAIRQLELNKDFIVAELTSYVNDYYKDTVSFLDPADNSITVSSTEWIHPRLAIKFVAGDDSTNALVDSGLTADTTYYVRDVLSATKFTVSETVGGAEVVLAFTDAAFTVEKAYQYNTTLCERDVGLYIDAIKWDLQYPQQWKRDYTDGIKIRVPATYKSRLAARYYINSVMGSQEEDFFYLRNGTGLRLMTMDGLNGDLTPPNEFGTSRVTAGAYASLDPGWGPADERVWITSRSPYVQNCTTFGYAAVGQKIDGALHDGGNDSIVSNDFTQVISDGIGAWITNNGRAELVSVFTYYSHIGYLAEAGGRIRATNGNNSYGTFGSVAEGVDPEETPVTAIVDNRLQYNASISNVQTDRDQLLQLEFDHAGNEYTDAEVQIFGAGDGEELVVDDFRDRAVNRVRILDLDDSSGEQGGLGYTVVANTAQTGTTSNITIAATDGTIGGGYNGMTIVLTGGQGAGQYAKITSYNSGSKLATVEKFSDGTSGWDHFIAGTAIVAPDATTTYTIEPSIEFTAPPSQETAITLPSSSAWTATHYLETSKEYLGLTGASSADGSGATFNVIRSGSKYYVSLAGGGENYTRLETVTIDGSVLDGTDLDNSITMIITTVNPTTGAIVEFDFEGYGLSGRFIAATSTTAGAYSEDGTTWTSLTLPTPGGSGWVDVASGLVDDGSSELQPSNAIFVADGSNNVAYTADGETFNTSTLTGLTAGGKKSIAFGQVEVAGRFVAISDQDQTVLYSGDGGANWITELNALPSTGFTALTYGKGLWVAVRGSDGESVTSANGIDWTLGGTGLTDVSSTYTDIAYGRNRFIAIDSVGGNAAYSFDGLNWTEVATGITPSRVAYGQGIFIITDESGNDIVWSEDGVVWTTTTVSATTRSVAFGNPQKVGQFATLQSGTTNGGFAVQQGARAKGRAGIASERLFEVRIFDPGSGYYSGLPTITATDPGNIYDAIFEVKLGDGAIAQPSFVSRGSNFEEATAEVTAAKSNGFADFFQTGSFIAVRRLSERPVNGSNVVFGSLPNQVFKLVNVISFLGENDGSYTAFLQISPNMEVIDSPDDGDSVTMRIRYSQARLTGHDFLDIGTGNFVDSNYPNTPVNTPDQANETVSADGGRVFFTATDQDGNFRVGPVFSVEQSTGVATLNAEAFNIAGLQELTLGEVTLGGNSASITEFSTDPFFTADSDTVVPTQRAVKAYIEAQIGGGGASLNVNTLTAGDIFIGTDTITTVDGEVINITANVNFTGGVLGLPLAYNFLLK